MVKAASPPPPLGLAIHFRFGLSWLQAEPSTGQGLTEAKDILGRCSPLRPHIGMRQRTRCTHFSLRGSRTWGLHIERELRG